MWCEVKTPTDTPMEPNRAVICVLSSYLRFIRVFAYHGHFRMVNVKWQEQKVFFMRKQKKNETQTATKWYTLLLSQSRVNVNWPVVRRGAFVDVWSASWSFSQKCHRFSFSTKKQNYAHKMSSWYNATGNIIIEMRQ